MEKKPESLQRPPNILRLGGVTVDIEPIDTVPSPCYTDARMPLELVLWHLEIWNEKKASVRGVKLNLIFLAVPQGIRHYHNPIRGEGLEEDQHE